MLLAVACFFIPAALQAADPAMAGPQAGQKVAFMGDSITDGGYHDANGYVRLVEGALEQQGRKIVVIPAGVGGDTSKDMLARLDKDVLSEKPDWMTLSCGVNDVWHKEKKTGVSLDDYKKNITSIVDQATAAGIKVIILTATMIKEDPSNAANQDLVAYNDFLRSLATAKHLPLADLNADMQKELAAQHAEVPQTKGNLLTRDGVHMNGLGNEMMAAGVLKAMGSTSAQIDQVQVGWRSAPDGMEVVGKTSISVNDYLKLRALANRQGRTVDELLQERVKQAINALLGTLAPSSARP